MFCFPAGAAPFARRIAGIFPVRNFGDDTDRAQACRVKIPDIRAIEIVAFLQ